MTAPVFPGGPNGAEFTDWRGPNGMLPQSMQLQGNTQGLDMLRGRVTGNAPSPWATMQQGNLQQNNMWAQSQMAQDVAKKNLAMRAGSANPEMSAWRGMQNSAQGMGGVQDQLRQQQMDLTLKDRANQIAGLKDQVGNEVNAMKPNEFNINNAMNEKRAADTSQFSNWQEQMKAWGASQQARAQINSGKK